MSLKLKIIGLNELGKRLSPRKRKNAILRGMQQGAMHIAGWIKEKRLSGGGRAKKVLNVRSGRLRTSITHGRVTKRGEVYTIPIGTNVKYGIFHEFGTSNMIARPFLRPGIENRKNKTQLLNLITLNIVDAMRRG